MMECRFVQQPFNCQVIREQKQKLKLCYHFQLSFMAYMANFYLKTITASKLLHFIESIFILLLYFINYHQFHHLQNTQIIFMDPFQKQQAILVQKQNSRTTKQLFTVKQISSQTRQLIDKELFQLYRIFHGPTPSLKILAIVKAYSIQIQAKFVFILKVTLINMDQQILDPIKIMWKETQKQILDVAVHPNGQQMIIAYIDEIEKYRLVISKEGTDNQHFQFQLEKSVKTEKLRVSDLKYHPSGKFLVGILRVSTNNNSLQGRTFKLDRQTLLYKTGTESLDICFSTYRNFYLVKNLIAIDKLNQSMAMIGGGDYKLCLWNMDTGKFGDRQLSQSSNIFDNWIETPYQSTFASLSDSVLSFNYQDQSFLASLDSRNFIGYLYNTYNSQYQDVFSYSLAKRDSCSNKDCVRRSVYCIDIPQISSIACSTENLNLTSVIKISFQKKITYQVIPQFPLTLATNKSETKENFYYQPKSQICIVIDNRIECNSLLTQCGENKQLKPIHQCRSQCIFQNQNNVWNPIQNLCEPCTSKCTCLKHYQYYDYFFKKCVVNCTLVKGAVEYSESSKKQRCLCREPYQWFQQIQGCRINCSSIPYSLPNGKLDRQNIDTCECRNNFFFSKKLGSEKTEVGQCILKCRKGNPKFENGKLFCECQENEVWDQNSFLCKNKYLSLMPGWSIALIVIIVLGIIGLIIYAIIRWKRKKAPADDQAHDNELDKKEYDKDLNKDEEKETKGLQSKETPLSQRNIKMQKESYQNNEDFVIQQQKCVICNKQTPPPNHTGSCFHGFHKECYDRQKSKCPLCEVGQKQQMLSIENDFN